MAYIEKRKTQDGDIKYRVLVRLKGHPTQTATFERLTDARNWAQQTESAIREGRHFKTSESKKHTLAKLINRYMQDHLPLKTKSKQEGQLLWWKEQVGSYALSEITPALIGQYRDKLAQGLTPTGSKRAPATVVRYLAALSHCLTIAVTEYGWIDDSPMRKVSKPKLPRGRVRFLSDEERSALLSACKESTNPFLYIVVVLALSTGMRQGEIMKLRWEDIDLFRGRIILHETKNGERRVVPLKGLALKLLQGLIKMQSRDFGFLFPSQKDQKSQKPKPIDLRFPWEVALKATDITNFRFHDLRHSTASYLAMDGASLAEIAEVLGHKTLAMVKRYAHLSEAHTSGVVEKMNEKIFNP